MKIAIITDGNNTLGMGHVYQSICLAGLLLEKDITLNNIIFMTKSHENVLTLIEDSGFLVNQFVDDNAIYDALVKKNPDRIIFDKLDVSPRLAMRIKENLSAKLIIFTNLTEANNYADITVLARVGINIKNVVNHNSFTKIEYIGPKYWLLRSEFYILKEKKKRHNLELKNIMLMFGGSDPNNFSTSVLKELLRIDSAFNILIVLGISFEHDGLLNEILAQNNESKSNVVVLRNINNVGEMMFKSDILITSPGISFFESLAIGTPVIAFGQNEQHKKEFGAFLPIMDYTDVKKLPSLIEDRSFIFPNDPFIATMEIGEGKDEILDEIIN